MSYKYKVVPFIASIKEGETATAIAEQLQSTIESNSGGGWEFYQMGDVNVEITPGCLSALLGKKSAYLSYNQIVFRKQV